VLTEPSTVRASPTSRGMWTPRSDGNVAQARTIAAQPATYGGHNRLPPSITRDFSGADGAGLWRASNSNGIGPGISATVIAATRGLGWSSFAIKGPRAVTPEQRGEK